MSSQQNIRSLKSGLTLEFPQSLGVYDEYEQAQKAVDFLSDHEFPVENCMIVGTELKQVERVTGRLTTGRVALGGLLSGRLDGPVHRPDLLVLRHRQRARRSSSSTVAFGALFGVIWALVGYAATRGQRDFSSVSRIVATRYEVLVEHKHAAAGRELLAQLPGHTASQQTF